ncbi:MAG: aspartyl protease family protein [Pseudomonadota bacterium]
MHNIFYAFGMALLSASGSGIPVQDQISNNQTASTDSSASDVDVVAVEIDPVYRMTVPVTIDGQGPYSFLIDTGSERSVVSTDLAGQLELEFVEQVRLQSIAGNKIVDTAYLPDLTVGQQNYGGVIAPLLLTEDIGADGILGLDGLQNQRILFDFRKNQIEIEDVGEASNRGYEIIVTGRRKSGQLILTDATISGIDVTVVIDTGAQSSIGNRALQKRLFGRRAQGTDFQAELFAVTGQTIIADSGVAKDFRIGRAQFSHIGIAFADAPPFRTLGLENKPALFLGMSALRRFDRVAIDFQKRRVLFDVPGSARRYQDKRY